jgi:hypothetical protein
MVIFLDSSRDVRVAFGPWRSDLGQSGFVSDSQQGEYRRGPPKNLAACGGYIFLRPPRPCGAHRVCLDWDGFRACLKNPAIQSGDLTFQPAGR